MLAERNLTDRESLTTRGKFALDVGLNQEALEVFQRFSLEFPDDPLPKFYQAAALEALDRPGEALKQLSAAISIEPANYFIVIGRCRHFIEAGNMSAAQVDWRTASRLRAGDWTDQHRMGICFSTGDMVGAEKAILDLRTTGSPEFKSKSFALEACLRGEQDDLSAAEAALHKGLLFDSENTVPPSYLFIKRRLLVQLLIQRRDFGAAKQICRDVLKRAAGKEFRLQIAGLLAELGEFDEALGACGDPICLAKEEPAWPVYEYWRRRLEFELALGAHDPRRAAKILAGAPDPPFRHTFPAHLLRAVDRFHSPIFTEALRDALRNGPGRWWLEPERNPPGIYNRSRKFLAAIAVG